MLMVKTRIRQFREELLEPKISQEAMARRVGISLQWYRQLENGLALHTSYSTAIALLAALNTERERRHLDGLNLEQLELQIV